MATKYAFHLSIYSNCDKITVIETYLRTKLGSLSQQFLECVADSYYPIALCSDSTKTNQEILVATIESLSHLSAQMTYIANFVKADRGVDITPDMLSNFGLLPSVQYLSVESPNIDFPEVLRQRHSSMLDEPSNEIAEILNQVPVIEFDRTEEKQTIDDEDEDEDDPYAGMSDEEYLAATAHLSYSPPAQY